MAGLQRESRGDSVFERGFIPSGAAIQAGGVGQGVASADGGAEGAPLERIFPKLLVKLRGEKGVQSRDRQDGREGRGRRGKK